jgi:hypothetical protein
MEVTSIAAGWSLIMAIVLVNRATDPIPFSWHTIAVTVIEYGTARGRRGGAYHSCRISREQSGGPSSTMKRTSGP